MAYLSIVSANETTDFWNTIGLYPVKIKSSGNADFNSTVDNSVPLQIISVVALSYYGFGW
jgi:hypothetical protein